MTWEYTLVEILHQLKSVGRGCYLDALTWTLRNTILLIFSVDLVTKRLPKKNLSGFSGQKYFFTAWIVRAKKS